MKSFLALLLVALCGTVGAFAPRSTFLPSQPLAVSRNGGSSMITMNAAERTYIMVSQMTCCLFWNARSLCTIFLQITPSSNLVIPPSRLARQIKPDGVQVRRSDGEFFSS